MTVQVFVTVGTSAINNNLDVTGEKDGKKVIAALRQKGNEDPYYKNLSKSLTEKIANILNSYSGPRDRRGFQPYTAELGSLLAMQRDRETFKFGMGSADNHLYLLHTDTTEGQLCAEVLAAVLKGEIGQQKLPCTPQVIKIASLKVDSADGFKEGLTNLEKMVREFCHKKNQNDIRAFNVTGGYKAIIPYATALAWDLDMFLCYLYEDSNDLLIIPRPLDTCIDIFAQLIKKTKTSSSGLSSRMDGPPDEW